MITKRATNADVEYRAVPLTDDEHDDDESGPHAVELTSTSTRHTKSSGDDHIRRDSDVQLLSVGGTSLCNRFCRGSHCCNRCCRWLCCKKGGIFTLFSVLSFLLGAGIFLYFACRPVPYTSHILPLTSEPAAFNNAVKILLVGDSLWGIPQVSTHETIRLMQMVSIISSIRYSLPSSCLLILCAVYTAAANRSM